MGTIKTNLACPKGGVHVLDTNKRFDKGSSTQYACRKCHRGVDY